MCVYLANKCGISLFDQQLLTFDVDRKEACAITSDSFESIDNITVLTSCDPNVKHIFETAAIEEWIERKPICPQCRGRDISRIEYKSIEAFTKEHPDYRLRDEERQAKDLSMKRFVRLENVPRPAILKIMNSIPFKAVAIAVNTVHWVTYALTGFVAETAKSVNKLFSFFVAVIGCVISIPWSILCAVARGVVVVARAIFCCPVGENFAASFRELANKPCQIFSAWFRHREVIDAKIDHCLSYLRPTHTPCSIVNNSLLPYRQA